MCLFSCKNNTSKHTDDKLLIKGKITNAGGKQITLQILKFNDKQMLDSLVLKDDGAFCFKQKPNEKSIYLLKKDDNHYITLIAAKGDTLNLITDYADFEKKYFVEGSVESELLCDFNNHLQANLKILDSIAEVWKTAINQANRIEIKQQLDLIFYKAAKNQYDFQKKFVEKNTSSLAALIVLYIPFGREAVLKESSDFALFEKVSQDLIKALPENSHALNFAKRIKQRKMQELEKELTEKKQFTN